MKSFLLILLCFLSFFCFGKGGGGGGHSSGGGSHSSSHGESSSHSSAHEGSVAHESVSSEHTYSPSVTKTYFVQPNGMYWVLLLNHHTNRMDTISAASKDELDKKVNDLSGSNSISGIVWFMVIIAIFFLIIYLVVTKKSK